MDVGTLVTRAARRFPDRIAVDGPGRSLTFAELAGRGVRLAKAVRAMGLQPGDRGLDLQSNSVTYLETDLAIRAAGLVRAALNYRLHPSDWERIAIDSGARASISDAKFADQSAALRGQLAHVVVIGDGPGTAYEQL